MSDTSLEVALSKTPEVLEHSLVTVMRNMARKIVETPQVKSGLVAAESIPVGLVVTEENEAIALTDAVRVVIDAERSLEADVRAILRIPNAMEQTVRVAVAAEKVALMQAKERGNGARVAYQSELRRRAAAEEARAQREADDAAARTAARADLTGEDVPPPAEIAPIVVPRTVSAGAGKSGTSIRVAALEIIDPAQVPKNWLAIIRVVAEGFFLTAEREGKVARAAPGESVVWQGVRFETVERAVNR